MEKITSYLIHSTVEDAGIVKAWEEDILLPTYETGEEEKNPMFLEKRVYQGSSGVVYPYPVIEKIREEKTEKTYKALFLENNYLKVMVLPELGGRVQMAYDKIRQRHFVYYNQVVKPALVGLTGPWISGGIEFNWPQHHRPSTFLPVEYRIERHSDGSQTVWCNEVERMFGMKGMQGFTLYPDKAYLEISVKVYNRTPFPQTFLWWANPAVSVNDTYKSVFPPDVHAVFDHGKRDVSTFPIATGVYYKQDYSSGVDISRYKNIPVPTSYMAVESKYDFLGGYDDGVEAGLLHIANHRMVPGKKQWTWGNGDFGKAWDRNLTDENGPYIELMVGAYTDNQPDFSWLQPYEEKSWTHYFMPYTEVGYVKKATKDLILNLDVREDSIEIILYATSARKGVVLSLERSEGDVLFTGTADLTPEKAFKHQIKAGGLKPEELLLTVTGKEGEVLLTYQPEKAEISSIPTPASAAKDPKEIKEIEQLFLTGQHLEQYRHATYDPLDYYREALSRDGGDSRCNNAVGLWLMRKGQFQKAQPYFETAIATLTRRNPNPSDGEAYYNLGWCLKMQLQYDKAYEAFFKSTWNAAWQDAGYFAAAQIDCIKKNWTAALENIDRSLVRNWHNHKGRQLKASILRKAERKEEALKWIEESLQIDGFNIGCLFEKQLLTRDPKELADLKCLLLDNPHTYLAYALDFANAGLYPEAIAFLRMHTDGKEAAYPMIYYALGYFAFLNDEPREAEVYCRKGASMSPDKCFPNDIEEVNILRYALSVDPKDAKAFYYLGNFWYGHKQYDEAIDCWEKSIAVCDTFPTVLRNLSLAYYNKAHKKEEARKLLEKAFSLGANDPRLLMELDQLYKKSNDSPSARLAFLERHLPLVEERDDLCIERITLYNQLGAYEKAKQLLSERNFHPWEGGEGKVTSQYTFCRVELAKKAMQEKEFNAALQLLNETDAYPPNLGEGKLSTIRENDIEYYKGLCYKGLKDEKAADRWLRKAASGSEEPRQAFFYNDAAPDKILYQGLALQALGETERAEERFRALVSYGEKHKDDVCKIDYFAVSLPDLAIWEDDLNGRNLIHCYYVMALGYIGLLEKAKAKDLLERVRLLDVNHQKAQAFLRQI